MGTTDKYVLALDQGTTSSRTLLIDHNGKIVKSSQQDFEQLFPKPGWVEHRPEDIWNSQLQTLKTVLANLDQLDEIAALGITNQRETTLVWDRETAEPVCNAIVWQDRRTASYCDQLVADGHSEMIKSKTGLLIDAYFSATKLKWILDEVEGVRERAENGGLCFGTVDSWLIYKLTEGKVFVTDVSNASRTMLCNIHEAAWDKELLELFNIPAAMLPEIIGSSEVCGHTAVGVIGAQIPIAGIAGDQQAALFGQLCHQQGMAKNTYGTGCFLLMNTGTKPVYSKNNLLTTIAWKINEDVFYALEGSVFMGGATVQWIRDGLGLVESAADIEALASEAEDTGGVYLVPAFTGLGAPYWDPYARAAILGLTRGTSKAHIARAALEGIAFQVWEVVKAMEEDSGQACTQMRVDGGASANNLLMQIQADLCDFEVIRPEILESTALGAAYLAGLATGFWENLDALNSYWIKDRSFNPNLDDARRKQLISGWKSAIRSVKSMSGE